MPRRRHAAQSGVFNLLNNALKYRDPKRPCRISVTGRVEDDRAVYSIEDNGIGIAPEHQEKIFGLFERLHNNASYPGTGVGLAIVRKAVERMNGRVGLLSKPGEGSRFWLELPRLANESPPAQPALAPAMA